MTNQQTNWDMNAVNDATGFADGDLFEDEGDVLTYFTIESMLQMGFQPDEIDTPAALADMADAVLANRWHMVPIEIEVCSNSEWIGHNILDEDVLDDRDEAAEHWFSAVSRKLEDLGYAAVPAKGHRSMYHGWNGANLFSRKGCGLGTFSDEVTDEAWSEVANAALDLADEIDTQSAALRATRQAEADASIVAE